MPFAINSGVGFSTFVGDSWRIFDVDGDKGGDVRGDGGEERGGVGKDEVDEENEDEEEFGGELDVLRFVGGEGGGRDEEDDESEGEEDVLRFLRDEEVAGTLRIL